MYGGRRGPLANSPPGINAHSVRVARLLDTCGAGDVEVMYVRSRAAAGAWSEGANTPPSPSCVRGRQGPVAVIALRGWTWSGVHADGFRDCVGYHRCARDRGTVPVFEREEGWTATDGRAGTTRGYTSAGSLMDQNVYFNIRLANIAAVTVSLLMLCLSADQRIFAAV